MKILVLSNYWPPEIGAPSHLAFEMGETLVGFGHDVTVVTGFPRHNVKEMPPAYQGRSRLEETMGGMRVLRIAVPGTHGASKIRRGIGHLVAGPRMALRAMSLPRPDVIYTVSPPLPMGLAAWAVARRMRVPFVFGVQDLFPQSAIDLGVLRNRALIAAFERMERFIYRRADAITVHSEGNRDHILAKGGRSGRVHVAENWVDTEFIRPMPRDNSVRAEAGLRDEFVVGFAGTMGWSQGLGVAVEAARRVAGEPGLVFLFVGDGVEREGLERQASGLPNVRFLPMQPLTRYPEVLAAADTSLVVLRPEVATPVVPSKLMTIMAAGRPVLSSMPLAGDAPRIVTDAACGLTVPPGDPEALARAVLALKNDPEGSARMGASGRQWAVERFSRVACVREFEKAFFAAQGRTAPGAGGRAPEAAEAPAERGSGAGV